MITESSQTAANKDGYGQELVFLREFPLKDPERQNQKMAKNTESVFHASA